MGKWFTFESVQMLNRACHPLRLPVQAIYQNILVLKLHDTLNTPKSPHTLPLNRYHYHVQDEEGPCLLLPEPESLSRPFRQIQHLF